jgi:hypothetical protein
MSTRRHRSSVLAPPIRRWPTARAKAWTLRFLEDAAVNEDIIAVVAVGSAVRAGVPSLDLDLVVICREPKTLSSSPPIEVDLRTYQADEALEQSVPRGPHGPKAAVRE